MMHVRRLTFLFAFLFAGASCSAAEPFQAVACEGIYPDHLQGVCIDGVDAIYWSFTTQLVKTGRDGRIVRKVDVADHHGDLCFLEGKVYVAVNLGKFNQPAGQADSWVYVYDGETLAEIAKHKLPEAVHGAGGIAFRDGRFFVVGGLPAGAKENYVYEYDAAFAFQKRHVVDSGYTLMGIQTVAHDGTNWWFGCYGLPRVLLKADHDFHVVGRWQLDGSLGIVPLGDGRFLIARGRKQGKGNTGALREAVADGERGLRFLDDEGAR